MKTISLKLPESLTARLSNSAQQSGRAKSAIVREAIEEYLDRDRRRARGSCLDLAADLAGCTEGPADLSSNPRHLKGLGQ